MVPEAKKHPPVLTRPGPSGRPAAGPARLGPGPAQAAERPQHGAAAQQLPRPAGPGDRRRQRWAGGGGRRAARGAGADAVFPAGIGRAVAVALSRAGARVTALSRTAGDLESLAREVPGSPGRPPLPRAGLR